MTTEERQEIIQEVVNEIVTQSTSIDELPSATSTEDVESLPAYKKETSELISMPISLISKPAVDAATAANTAAENANLAKQNADAATSAANNAAKAANDSAMVADEAASTVLGQIETIERINTTATNADTLSKANAEKLNGLSLEPITETAYEALPDEEKKESTLYLCYEEEV